MIRYIVRYSQNKVSRHIVKKNIDTLEMINQRILSFSIQLGFIRYTIPTMVGNPLFLQPDRSFDFRINYVSQYTVSSTHSSPLKDIVNS